MGNDKTFLDQLIDMQDAEDEMVKDMTSEEYAQYVEGKLNGLCD